MTNAHGTLGHQFFTPDMLPYQELEKAANCLHRFRNPAGECIDLIGCADGAIPLDCPCRACDAADITRRTVCNPFSRSLVVLDVSAGLAGQVEECRVVACYNHGNGRECWLIRMPDGRRFFEFPDKATAMRLATEGGRVCATHSMRFC